MVIKMNSYESIPTSNNELENTPNKRLPLKMLLTYFGIFFLGTIFISLFFVLIYALLNNLPVTALFKPNGQLIDKADLFVNGWTNFASYLIGTSIIVWLGRKFLKDDLKKFNKDFFIFVIMGIGLNFLAGVISLQINDFLNIKGETTNQEAINKLVQSPYLILMVFTTIIFAPIVEELVFRKTLFNIVDAKKPLAPWITITLTGFLFGLIHVFIPIISAIFSNAGLIGTLNEFLFIIPYFLMGIAISLTYYKSNKNIWVVITVHAINNIIALIGVLFF